MKLFIIFGSVLVLLCVNQGHVCAQIRQPNVSELGTSAAAMRSDKAAAIEMLSLLADELKSESDNPDAIALLADVGEFFWATDESRARLILRIAFDAASKPSPELSTLDAKLREEQLKLARRRASVVSKVLRLLGKHDQTTAREWLAKYEAERSESDRAAKNKQALSELLGQLALDVSESDPEQAQRLGLASLTSTNVPETIGPLLFALSKRGKQLSDPILFAAIENLRRNGYPYSNVLSAACNYVFFSDGRVFSKDYAGQATLLINFFIEAAEAHVTESRLSRHGGVNAPLSRAAASFHFLFLSRVGSIIQVTAPDKVPAFQSLVLELAQGLNRQQIDEADNLARSIRQQRTLNELSASGLDEQIKKAESERDSVVRDNLWRMIAIGVMRSDADRALSVASKIDDLSIRRQTLDDIRLILIAGKVRERDYALARKFSLDLNDLGLRARSLAAIATVGLRARGVCDTDLLTEAYDFARKDDNRPERVRVVLKLASDFAKCGTGRSFEILSEAIDLANKLPAADDPPPSRKFKVESFTVVGGQELTTEVPASRESITFETVAEFATKDFPQAQSLGYRLKDRVLRVRFLITLARAVSTAPPTNSN